MANIGSASNNATGSNVVRKAITDRIDDAIDRIEDLIAQRQVAVVDLDKEKADQIQATIIRQQKELKKLEAQLRQLSYTL